ncbi:hypothetical protein D3C80_1414740 [compost metagenome]
MAPTKKPCTGRAFLLLQMLAAQPGINSSGAILLFPGFQAAMIAALGFDQFAGVRVLINLDHASAAGFGRSGLL